ncbi:MAG: MXAN_5187 C-terminal domain-containing protein [Terriglobales bacterium]
MTIDEELDLLDQMLRRLKIEYEIFFNNPAKRPPTDIEWKVLSLIRKFSDGSRMKFAQRYRYNEMAQRYAIQSDLWRKKTRIREEGYRAPHEAALSVQGVRASAERDAKFPTAYGLTRKGETAATADGPDGEAEAAEAGAFSVQVSGSVTEREKVAALYKALAEAKAKTGEKTTGTLNSFASFVQKKTSEIRREHGCSAVEYSIEMHDGQVRLKAKAKQ